MRQGVSLRQTANQTLLNGLQSVCLPSAQQANNGGEVVIVYHVTPRANEAAIMKRGIDPVFSRGKQQLSWFVAPNRIAWAIAHCSARHHIPVDQLVVFPVPFTRLKNWRKFRYDGIFATPCRTTVDISAPAEVLLDPQGVTDEDRA